MAKPFDFTDCHAFDADLGDRSFHVFEFEWFDDGFDFLHNRSSALAWFGGPCLSHFF
jgi:hypothetical protein